MPVFSRTGRAVQCVYLKVCFRQHVRMNVKSRLLELVDELRPLTKDSKELDLLDAVEGNIV